MEWFIVIYFGTHVWTAGVADEFACWFYASRNEDAQYRFNVTQPELWHLPFEVTALTKKHQPDHVECGGAVTPMG